MELKNYFAQSTQGAVLPGATCYLYQSGTEVLAEGLVNIANEPLSNPFVADESGLIQFAAPNGRYDLRVVQGGRDYRVRVQCNDVTDAINEVAALKAEIRNWYYGPLSEDPVTRPDGTDMEEGDEYHNTVDRSRRVFVQGVWTAFLGASTADLANADDPQKSAGMVGFRQVGVGCVARTVARKLGEVVSVKDFGAVGDGTLHTLQEWVDAGRFASLAAIQTAYPFATALTNSVDSIAIRAAIAHLHAIGGGTVYFPEGVYYHANNSPALLLPAGGSYRLLGAGMKASRIYMDDDIDTVRKNLLYSKKSEPIVDFSLKDIGLESTWGVGGVYAQRSQLVEVYMTGDAIVEGCEFSKSRFMSLVLEGGKCAVVTGNVFKDGIRDGCRVTGFDNVKIIGNHFFRINDDAIAVHSIDTQSSKYNVVVQGNTLEDCQGICVLGAKVFAINGNTLIRTMARAIAVGPTAGSEGNTPLLCGSITDNVIVDVFNGNTLCPGKNADLAQYIVLYGTPLTTVDGTHYIAGPDGAGGIVQPYDYYWLNDTDATNPNAGNWGIVVSGNTCKRTLREVAAYSDYGHGQRLTQTGYTNPAIALDDMGLYQIEVQESANGLIIANNNLDGASIDAIRFSVVTANAAITNWKNVKVVGNNLLNFGSTGLRSFGYGTLSVEMNDINGDPFHTHPARGANGTWGANCSSHRAVYPESGIHAAFQGNKIRNVGSIFYGSNPDKYLWIDNALFCNPVDVGYVSQNIGIGDVGRPIRYGKLVIEDGDPDSITYGQVLNVCQDIATTMPTTGKYLNGHVVKRASASIQGASGAKYALIGWLRVTNGNQHVLNIDWVEMRTPTGT